MTVCPNCGQENPEGFRFCGACGASLRAVPSPEERKVVTVLFADITASTELATRLDQLERQASAAWLFLLPSVPDLP